MGCPVKVTGITLSNRKVNAFRARSLAQRTVAAVEAEVDIFLSACQFLSRGVESPIAKLHRNEIRVSALLGKGAFSEVYQVAGFDLSSSSENDFEEEKLRKQLHLCGEKGNKSRFVIKHLRPDLAMQRSTFNNAAADLVIEAKFLSIIDHPNIIKMRGWASAGIASFGNGSHDGYFLLLDRLDETLAHRISQWRAEPATTPSISVRLGYASQIASALSYLHSNRILFRDLKCDNIGFKGDTVQLFDLGLCRELPENLDGSEELFQMSGVGTLRYLAPEIALGTGYNLKADIYSFSIVLYEILSLSTPFEMYTIDMYRMLVCEESARPRLNASWPQDLQALFQAMWAKDPSVRPTIQDVQRSLDEIISQTGLMMTVRRNILTALDIFSRRFARVASGKSSDETSMTVASTAEIEVL
eukprot:scaffold1830_cov117-Cylindrotheca_fusiformis.AAC.17